MRKSIVIKAVTISVLAFSCAQFMQPAAAQTAIIEKGAAKATIFVNAKAPDSVTRAAGDLQLHLKKITDVEVPISSNPNSLKGYVIYVGDTAFVRKQGIQAEKLPDDGFRILANKNWMVIAGKDYDGPPLSGFQDPFLVFQTYNKDLKLGMFGDTGTMFGVNYFLEQYCGVRWYAPGDLGTVIQRKNKVVVPAIDVKKWPYYPQRHAFYAYMDWFPEDMLWYRRAGFGSPFPVQITHSFVHLFSKYKDTHPEYFALIDGKRDFTNLSTEEGGGNLNLSDPGLIQQAIDDANKFFDENPGQDIFPLCPPDGMTKISEDPVSQAQIDDSQGPGGKFSNYVWGFINKVAKGIQAKHPDKFIGGFAYERYSMPPTNIDKLEDNVVLVLTKFRAQYPNPVIKERTDKRIAEWSKKVKVIYGWEYYCNPLYNRAWRGFPMSFPKILQEDLQALKGISRGEFIEAETWANSNPGRERDDIRLKFRGLDSLLLYTTARMLWNPDLDRHALLSEYYKLFYGPGEVPMRGFWELVESTWIKKGWQMSPYQVYDTATINKLLNYLKTAKDKTAQGSVYRQRIDLMLTEFTPAAQIAVKQATLPYPSAEVPQLTTAPAVDGPALPPLVTGPPLSSFLDRNFNQASPVTNAQVAWDKKNLYVDLRCYEPAMDKLKLLAKERDSTMPGVYDDDCVEIFISPKAAEPEKTFHYVVNANGALFDARINKVNTPEDFAWNGNAVITTRKEVNRWIVRMAIPWSDLGVQNPEAGRKMAANFTRSRHAVPGDDMEYGWAPLRHVAYYTPEDFGTLTLSAQAPAAAPQAPPTVIQPGSIKEYGSGASTVDIYYDGGVPDTGLFVGQANPYVRNDRVLCKFNLVPLLEAGDKIEKVELTFGIVYVTGKKNERTISVRYYPQPVGELNASVLGTGDPVQHTTVKVTQADSFTLAQENKQPYVPQRVDVTKLVKDAISKGQTSLTFRWQDEEAELGNSDMLATGTVLSGEKNGGLPALHVKLSN